MATSKITIDMTPKWTAILPVLIDAIQSHDTRRSAPALLELRRMAEVADMYVSEHKKRK